MSASRRKGTAWETAVVRYLQANGVPGAERRALRGNLDCGDIAGVDKVVIECKSAARMNLAGWVDETETEVRNQGADLGVAWVKRRGATSPGEGYVVMTGATLVWLLAAAGYLPENNGRESNGLG